MDENNTIYMCNNSNNVNSNCFNTAITGSPFMGFSNSVISDFQTQCEQIKYYSTFPDQTENFNNENSVQFSYSSSLITACINTEFPSFTYASDSSRSERSIILETPVKENVPNLNLSINTLNQDIELPYISEIFVKNNLETSRRSDPAGEYNLCSELIDLNDSSVDLEKSVSLSTSGDHILNKSIILDTPVNDNSTNTSINTLNHDIILPYNLETSPDLVQNCNLNADLINLNDSSINLADGTVESVKNTESDQILENIAVSDNDISFETPRKCPSSCMKKSNVISPIKKTISFNLKTSETTPTEHDLSYADDKNISAEYSPEMFSDDEYSSERNDSKISDTSFGRMSLTCPENTGKVQEDKKLLKRLQESCAGILPPPSVTICQLNSVNILSKYNENKVMFETKQNSCDNFSGGGDVTQKTICKRKKSILLNCNEEQAKQYVWPNIMELRYHGLHYNRSKVSEEIEHLCQKYAERFIGCETASSCTVWQTNAPSSASKRRMIRKQTAKSPGRRLSHLARRRITFSKENIGAKGSVLPNISTSSRQILVKNSMLLRRLSPRKAMSSPRKMISPRKKTPRKTPNGRSPRKRMTPGNSAKKRAARRLLLTNCDENQSTSSSTVLPNSNLKRALFQSPENRRLPYSEPKFKNVSDQSKILKSKRTLFATPENKKTDDNLNKKRKRSESDDDFTPQRDKFARSLSTNDVVPNKITGSQLSRRYSETFTSSSGDFNDNHTKKMLWAISTALRSQNVGMSHPKFKTYAASLSQVCKQLLPDLLPGGVRIPGSVTERMSKITHQHVYQVVKGKSVEEIVREARTKSAILSQKPKGYVALDSTFEISTQTSGGPKAEVKSKICRQIVFDNK